MLLAASSYLKNDQSSVFDVLHILNMITDSLSEDKVCFLCICAQFVIYFPSILSVFELTLRQRPGPGLLREESVGILGV